MDPPQFNKARMPLTNVSNNVSQSLQKQNIVPNNLPEHQRKPSYDEPFFAYRKNFGKSLSDDKDPFDQLSDEVILHILKWLPKKSLVRCSEVNHKLNRLSRDETLWIRMDLSGRRIHAESLGNLLKRGIIVLRMSQASVDRDIREPESGFPQHIKLQYLDLSMCSIDKDVLRALLEKCRFLVKLSLENVPLSESVCEEISENRRLESLNLTMCSGITTAGMRVMLKRLSKLQSLNVGWAYLTLETVSVLVNTLTPQILRLNIAGCRYTLTNDELSVLVKRCPKLLELDLSDCTRLTSEAIELICKLRKLEYLSLSRCYNINISSYLSLKDLHSLRFLDLFGLLCHNAIASLQHSFAGVGINKFFHSSVARPTVGTRRTSIWGIRTRE